MVLEIEGERSSRTDRPVCPDETAPGPGDQVRVLLEAVQRSDRSLHRALAVRSERPVDTQYWACWAVAVVYPIFLAYLWFTR
ncbi:hypothetical protein GCM10009616_32740 [Microlunatus lacustris]